MICPSVQGVFLWPILDFKACNVNCKGVSVIVCQLPLRLLNRPFLFGSLPWTSHRGFPCAFIVINPEGRAYFVINTHTLMQIFS